MFTMLAQLIINISLRLFHLPPYDYFFHITTIATVALVAAAASATR